MAALTPPFSEPQSLVAELVFPAAVQGSRRRPLIVPERAMEQFLSTELRTERLDKIHRHLWLAGLPLPARPLHRQKMMGREIHLTERPDEHLVWHRTKLLIKPLPEFLLCHAFWTEHICPDPALHRSATGMLLSYAWLVGHISDFASAREARLIPDDIDWRRWTEFMADFLQNIDIESLSHVDRRYHYGELRLSRLNTITRFLPTTWSWENFVRGHLTKSTWYEAFFERNFSWILACFVFVSVILSAMQVGLATKQLDENRAFDHLSYGVALLAIASVFLGTATLFVVWLVLFWYHLLSTMRLDRAIRAGRDDGLGKA